LSVRAQFDLRGTIIDSVTRKSLSKVSIENLSRREGVLSDAQGNYTIRVTPGDYVIFTCVGYKHKALQVQEGDDKAPMNIVLSPKAIVLKDVVVKKGLTKYQQDSIYRAQMYSKAFRYERQTSIFSPISLVQQTFSKRHRDMRKFKNQIVMMEDQKFIDSRYTPELVSELTGLQDDSLALFMRLYPMEYAFARSASELEIKMWIKYHYAEFIGDDRYKRKQ
jgi:hypothetical protein